MTVKFTITRTVTETVEFTLLDAIKLIASQKFLPFIKNDWYGYSGCETKDPLIARGDWNCFEFDCIQDGSTFEFHFHPDCSGPIDHLVTKVYIIDMKNLKMDYQEC